MAHCAHGKWSTQKKVDPSLSGGGEATDRRQAWRLEAHQTCAHMIRALPTSKEGVLWQKILLRRAYSDQVSRIVDTAATLGAMPRSSARRGFNRLLNFFGIVLILVGLGVLGWVAWQYYGTNIMAKREHDRLREEIIQAWDEPEKKIKGVGLLRVPRFGKDFEVPILDGLDDATLARGVGRGTEGAEPGEVGNLILSGHRVTHGEPFRDFPKLKAGDEVIVETRTHIYKYKLRDGGTDIRVDFSTSWPLWPVPSPDAETTEPTEPLVTLITCSELFHTKDRNVVVGELTSAESKK